MQRYISFTFKTRSEPAESEIERQRLNGGHRQTPACDDGPAARKRLGPSRTVYLEGETFFRHGCLRGNIARQIQIREGGQRLARARDSPVHARRCGARAACAGITVNIAQPSPESKFCQVIGANNLLIRFFDRDMTL